MDKDNLKELLGSGDLEQAFAAMLNYGKSRKAIVWYNTLLIQYHQFRNLEQNKREGILSAEEESLTRNRILSALLSLIDDLPDGSAGDGVDTTPLQKNRPRKAIGWGLLAALLLAGMIFGYSRLNRPVQSNGADPSSTEITVPKEKNTTARKLHFPNGDAITFLFSTGNEVTYRILDGELRDLGGNARQVVFTIRCAARKGNGINFWDETFRLELDEPDAFLAPSSGLNEVVDNNSFKDGTVSFEVKGSFSSMKLAMVSPWDKADIRKLTLGFE